MKPSDLTIDSSLQARTALDLALVAEYAEAMQAGAQFPAVVAFQAGAGPAYLADGFHRVKAAEEAELDVLCRVEVVADAYQAAFEFSLGANARHGLRRSNSDKRRSIERALRNEHTRRRSNRDLARLCAVDEKTIRNARAALSAENPQIAGDGVREVERNGTKYEMDTSGIGEREPRDLVDEYFGDAEEVHEPALGDRGEAALGCLADAFEERDLADEVEAEVDERAFNRDHYRTPPEIFDPLAEVFDFTLDAAADEHNAKCAAYFDEERNGSACEWAALGWTWCNPPYSWGCPPFTEHAEAQAKRGRPSVLLVAADTSTKWFQRALGAAAAVCFVKGRIAFLKPDGEQDGPARFASALLVYSSEYLVAEQLAALKAIGHVVENTELEYE